MSFPKMSDRYELVIYPDSDAYSCSTVLEQIKAEVPEWAFILHDQDVVEATGELKKAHYHVLIRYKEPVHPTLVLANFRLPNSAIAGVRKWTSALRYLIHADDTDKHPYDLDQVEANPSLLRHIKRICGCQPDEGADVRRLLAALYNCRNINELAIWALDNELWASFRRNYSILKNFFYDNGGN